MSIASQTEKYWPSFEWRYLLLLPVAAAIVHIVATFIAMSDNQNSAYRRMSPALPVNAMKVIAPVAPGQQPLPFLSDDARYAMCRFSSRQGPVDVKATLPGLGWTLGVYNVDGSTAYFAAGAAGHPTAVAVTLLPGDDRFLGLSPQALGKSAVASPLLTITAKDGLIVVRAPNRGAAMRQSQEVILAKASCSAQSF
jgi:uncharacterized membrane protein